MDISYSHPIYMHNKYIEYVKPIQGFFLKEALKCLQKGAGLLKQTKKKRGRRRGAKTPSKEIQGSLLSHWRDVTQGHSGLKTHIPS